jgi:hypothetical protein
MNARFSRPTYKWHPLKICRSKSLVLKDRSNECHGGTLCVASFAASPESLKGANHAKECHLDPPMNATGILCKNIGNSVFLAKECHSPCEPRQLALFATAKPSPEYRGNPPAPPGREWLKSFITPEVWALIEAPPGNVRKPRRRSA